MGPVSVWKRGITHALSPSSAALNLPARNRSRRGTAHPIQLASPAIYPPRMDFAFSRPPPSLTLLQRLLWPLIYLQLRAMRDWVRARYGCVPYWIRISRFGRVQLCHVPLDFTRSHASGIALRTGYNAGAFDYASGLTRPILGAACRAEDTPAPPCLVPSMLSVPAARMQSGQATLLMGMACPDTS